MLLRVLILGIILIVVTWFIWMCNKEGFQSGPSYTLPAPASPEQIRTQFWSILNQQKTWNIPKPILSYKTNFDGSSSGTSTGSASVTPSNVGSGTKALLNAVQNPGPSDLFTVVFPNYISIYALAKYKMDPKAARYALINNYDALQQELITSVQTGSELTESALSATATAYAACQDLNNLAMALYGQIIKVNAAVKGANETEILAESLHDENMRFQGSVSGAGGACTNQAATPSAACIQLATQNEKMFPLLSTYNKANKTLLTDGDKLQSILDTVLQAYIGLKDCPLSSITPNAGDAYPYINPPSIASVFSQKYLDNLGIISAEELSIKLEELSPYYISTNTLRFITNQLIAGTEFKADLQTTADYIRDMSKTANAVISITGQNSGSRRFFYELGGSFGDIGQLISCPGGYYCPKTSPTPIICPGGSFCPSGATDSPYLCSQQDQVAYGPYSKSGASDISECIKTIPDGFYAVIDIDSSQNPPVTTTTQVQCPAGTYCIGGKVFGCAAGTYNSKQGSSMSTACLQCPAGSYCMTSGITVVASTGTTVIGAALPTPCAAGKFSTTIGAQSSATCQSCPAGTICAGTGISAPTPCPAGTWSSQIENRRECNLGPEGYYSTSLGLTSPSPSPTGFIICSVGRYCPAGSNSEMPCGPGNYCNNTGMISPNKCPKGRYGSSVYNTNPLCDGPCSAGYYCDEGSVIPTQGICPPGFYCTVGTPLPIACPPSKYCVQGTSVPANCAPGTTSTGGATDITACNNCPAGSYCDGNGNNPVTCPIGTYCPGGTSIPIRCPAGSYCDRTGMTNNSPCPRGTYNPDTGATSILRCIPCPPGKYNPDTGKNLCYGTCSIGTYCPTNNKCFNYQNPSGGSSGVVPTGTINPIPCPVGTYCDTQGMSTPTLCPSGTYSKSIGATSLSACITCPSGTNCPTGGSQPQCPGGGSRP